MFLQEAKRQGDLAANLQDGFNDESSVNTVSLTRQSLQVPNIVIRQQLPTAVETQNLLRTSGNRVSFFQNVLCFKEEDIQNDVVCIVQG